MYCCVKIIIANSRTVGDFQKDTLHSTKIVLEFQETLFFFISDGFFLFFQIGIWSVLRFVPPCPTPPPPPIKKIRCFWASQLVTHFDVECLSLTPYKDRRQDFQIVFSKYHLGNFFIHTLALSTRFCYHFYYWCNL